MRLTQLWLEYTLVTGVIALGLVVAAGGHGTRSPAMSAGRSQQARTAVRSTKVLQ